MGNDIWSSDRRRSEASDDRSDVVCSTAFIAGTFGPLPDAPCSAVQITHKFPRRGNILIR